MDLIKYEKGTGSGFLHLPAVPCQNMETLCGIFMGDGYPEDIEGIEPTCPYCIKIAKALFGRYQKKIVKSWDKN